MPPPPPFGWSPSPASRGRMCDTLLATSHVRALATTTHQIDAPPATKEGAERREAHANHVRAAQTRSLRHSSATRLRDPCERRARLSALTLAVLAAGYYPDGSATEPGFPKTDFASVLPAWPACLRLSTLRADRSFCRSTGDPEPPGSGLHPSARGHRLLLRASKVPLRKAPSLSRMSIRNIIGDECQRYPTTVS